MARTPEGPRVGSIICVEDDTTSADSTAFTATEVFVRDANEDRLRWTGNVPGRVTQAFADAGLDLRSIVDTGVDA